MRFWVVLGLHWDHHLTAILDRHFGSILCDFGSILGPFYAILGPFSAILGHFGSPLGPPLDGHFGTAILLPFCAILGPFCAILGPFR